MNEKSQTQFLDHKSYRQKRLTDASKLLPIVGMLAFILPPIYLFSPLDVQLSPGSTAIFLFVVWIVLILCAAVLAPLMQSRSNTD